MDQKPDSQKRQLCQRDDKLSCPDCKDLEEHRNKKCPKQLVTKTLDAGNTMEVADEKDDTESRTSYQCEDCHLSFDSSQKLEDHPKGNCLKMPIPNPNRASSYEACIDSLRSALHDEKCFFRLLNIKRTQINQAVKRYASAKKQRDLAHKDFAEAICRDQTLRVSLTAEEQELLSYITTRYEQNLISARQELEMAGQAVNHAVYMLKIHNQLVTSAGTQVQSAYSDAMTALTNRRFATFPPKTEGQGMKEIQDLLIQRNPIFTDLQVRGRELEDSVSLMLGIEQKKEEPRPTESESGRESAATTSESEDSRAHMPNTMQETVNYSQPNQMNESIENLDDPKPSTSGYSC